VNAEADAGGLRDVLEQVHLLAVIVDAVDAVALAPHRIEQAALLDLGRQAVDQDVGAALRGIDELEALARIGRRIGGEMVRDRHRVAVVPILDPGQRLAALEVLRVGAATELGGGEEDIVTQRAEARLAAGGGETIHVDAGGACLGSAVADQGPKPVAERSGHDTAADRAQNRAPIDDAVLLADDLRPFRHAPPPPATICSSQTG
jgi:hypothetical protein